MFDDDAELLEHELVAPLRGGVRGQRGRSARTFRGASAILAFAILYTVGLMLVTMMVWANIGPHEPSSFVVSPGACGLLVVMGVEFFVAQALATATWRALGPSGRGMIRPLMVFGPMPLVVLIGFGGLLLLALLRGPRPH
ncbi:MAG: hypothetical protein JNG84_00125 [Archangium sp.]|nr:hypothetical protein [Archangium sp.]